LASLGINDQRAEGRWERSFERACREANELAHALFIERSHTHPAGSRGWHGAI
jgi:hypothetical protein